jgi:hypothetical protein
MEPRTEIDFERVEDIQKIVDDWAAAHDYKFLEMEEDMRVYQRGSGFWTAPMRLGYRQTGERVHMEAYVYAPLLNRIMSLFLVPKECKIESGGFVASIPRAMARKDVNNLLETLGQPPLK